MDWFKKATKYLDENNYSQALCSINKYVDIKPESKQGKLYQAVINRIICNYQQSLKILKKIQPVKSDNLTYKLCYSSEMAETYQEIGDFRKAIIWWDKYILLAPNKTQGYILKGAYLAKSGKYKLAKSEHLKATLLEGNPEEAFYNLALICRAESNFTEAKLFCEKSLSIDPTDKVVKHLLSDIKKAIKLTQK